MAQLIDVLVFATKVGMSAEAVRLFWKLKIN